MRRNFGGEIFSRRQIFSQPQITHLLFAVESKTAKRKIRGRGLGGRMRVAGKHEKVNGGAVVLARAADVEASARREACAAGGQIIFDDRGCVCANAVGTRLARNGERTAADAAVDKRFLPTRRGGFPF